MADRILRNAEDVDAFIRLLGGLKLPVSVAWSPGADRSGQQNRLQWLWAAEVAQQFGDRDPSDVQAEWKLTVGVPILRADDAEFRADYDAMIRPLPYESKVRAMKHLGFDVTSRMKVRQMVRFLDEVQRQCLEMGLRLTEPDTDLAEYHSRYRAQPEPAQNTAP